MVSTKISKQKYQEMNNNFCPTRLQILKALEDQENGRKIEPAMAAYLKAEEATDESLKIQQEVIRAKEMAVGINLALTLLLHVTEEALKEVENKYPRAIRLVRKLRDEKLVYFHSVKIQDEFTSTLQWAEQLESGLKRLSHMTEEVLAEVSQKYKWVRHEKGNETWGFGVLRTAERKTRLSRE